MTAAILIIDDDQAFRKILQLRLKAFIPDADITQKISLTEARQFLTTNTKQFDLVILDEHLTDGRGVELLTEGWFKDLAVLSVSSDDNPQIPGASIKAGAAYFLNKSRVSEPLFKPLVEGILDRNRLQRELEKARMEAVKVETIKTLVSTLRHEINNPLGAVLGGAYLIRNLGNATKEQREAAELVESSGRRIKHVLDELCKAIEVQAVQKAEHAVFQIPGDKPWEKEEG
jgi:DNA-binding NarL/FixJ family response regulator